MKKEEYIGVFDSGVGGVSVLQAIHEMMPGENLYFFGDSLNAPYGEKTLEDVQQLTLNAIENMNKKKHLKGHRDCLQYSNKCCSDIIKRKIYRYSCHWYRTCIKTSSTF